MGIFFVLFTFLCAWRSRQEPHLGGFCGTLLRHSAGALDWTGDRAGRGANSACALGRGRTLLPARGPRRSRGFWSCCARWGAGTCRLEALHAEVRCLRDRALPGTSAWWEPKEGSKRGTGTLRGHPRPPQTETAFFLTLLLAFR